VEPGGYCARFDTMFNLAGVHVPDVGWLEGRGRLPAGVRLIVETRGGDGVPGLRVIAEARGRRSRRSHDIPAFGALVELVWRQRQFRCAEPACHVRGFSEEHALAVSRAATQKQTPMTAPSAIIHSSVRGPGRLP